MFIQSWTDVIVSSFQNVWLSIMNYLPHVLGALIVFIVGLIVATGLASLIERIFSILKIDALIAKLGIGVYFERAGLELNVGKFLGQLVFWFLLIVFFLATSDILGFSALSSFFSNVLLYVPNIVIAVLIVLAGAILANFLREVVRASISSAKINGAKFLSTLAWWSVIVFTLLAAFVQLGIAVSLINTIVTGLVAMIALAGGIAFGMGGKDYAAHLLQKLREATEENHKK